MKDKINIGIIRDQKLQAIIGVTQPFTKKNNSLHIFI